MGRRTSVYDKDCFFQPKIQALGVDKNGTNVFFKLFGSGKAGFLFLGDSTEGGHILTFDQYKQDQVLSLRYNENSKNGQKQ
jgi:hypothetical protein